MLQEEKGHVSQGKYQKQTMIHTAYIICLAQFQKFKYINFWRPYVKGNKVKEIIYLSRIYLNNKLIGNN